MCYFNVRLFNDFEYRYKSIAHGTKIFYKISFIKLVHKTFRYNNQVPYCVQNIVHIKRYVPIKSENYFTKAIDYITLDIDLSGVRPVDQFSS